MQEKESNENHQYYISLMSQSKNHINIEVIMDHNSLRNPHDETKALKDTMEDSPWYMKAIDNKPKIGNMMMASQTEATLDFFVNITSKIDLVTGSEVVWINNNQLILTMNNNFFIIDLKHNDLTKVIGDYGVFMYGIQQVNMNIFTTVIRSSKSHSDKARI